jgi:hypothetical protein
LNENRIVKGFIDAVEWNYWSSYSSNLRSGES